MRRLKPHTCICLLCPTPHAGATSRLDKLRLLNHLLFGPGPPPRHRQFAAIPPPDGYGLQIVVRVGMPVVQAWGY